MTIQREVNTFTKNLERRIDRSLNKTVLRQIGKIAIDLIKKRTRRGLGVSQAGGRRSNLKALSPLYIEQRKRSKLLNRRLTRPSKSNLTFTGALLDSLIVVNVLESQKSVAINANRRRRKGGVTNEEVAEFVTAQGRAFLNLSAREQQDVVNEFNRSFRNQFIRNRS